MANRAQFLVLAWSKLLRVIQHLVRIARRNPRAVLRSPVLRGVTSSGFWLKLKNIVMYVVKGGSYIAAIITILEFLVAKRDITTDDALKQAKERGVENWLNEIDDPHDFLVRFVKQMPLKDERDRDIVLEALTQDLAEVSSKKATNGTVAQAQVSQIVPKPTMASSDEAAIIDASVPVQTRRSEQSQQMSASDASAANAVSLVLDVEKRLVRFYRDHGMRIDQLVNDIRFFAVPGVEAIVRQLFRSKPNLLNQ